VRITTFRKRTVIAYVVDDDSGGRRITVLGVFDGGQEWERALEEPGEAR
jgi:plasmid stabilization system protein ParE